MVIWIGLGEYVDVSVDGFSLGRVFDNNSSNDAFNFPADRGSQNTRTHTGSATIANSVFSGLIADGVLNILFDFSREVNFLGSVNRLSGSITFDETPAPVPLPASLGLLGFGLAGLGALRARRKSKATAAV